MESPPLSARAAEHDWFGLQEAASMRRERDVAAEPRSHSRQPPYSLSLRPLMCCIYMHPTIKSSSLAEQPHRVTTIPNL
jgi:hypothetical protein